MSNGCHKNKPFYNKIKIIVTQEVKRMRIPQLRYTSTLTVRQYSKLFFNNVNNATFCHFC